MAGKKDKRLHELRGSGYEMADGEPEIRGWQVRNLRGQTIGVIEELLFDTLSCKVRYLILNIKGKPLNIVSRKVLIPVGLAALHEENDDVILPNVTVGHLASLPVYNKSRFSAATERTIRHVFADTEMAEDVDADVTINEDNFYDHEHFDENRMYNNRKRRLQNDASVSVREENVSTGKQAVETGGIHVRKKITEEPVKENANRKEERNDINKPAQDGNFAPFQEGTIELTEHAEVPVVSKEARVIEEVSVGKDVEVHDETVHDTVRKTEVDIEELKKESES